VATPRPRKRGSAPGVAQAFGLKLGSKPSNLVAVLYPTPWQRKTLWNAITCIALLVIAGSVICTVYVASRVLLFLQPLLLPVAVAGVLAYLLEPLVTWLARRGLPRLIAVIIVFALFISSGALLLLGIGPNVYSESQKFSNALPGYFERSWSSLDNLLRENLERLPQIGPHQATPAPTPSPSGTAPGSEPDNPSQPKLEDNPWVQQSLQYLRDQLPGLAQRTWELVQSSLSGFFGAFGFLFGLFMVPVYLFFFLKESPTIAHTWSRYLPLRKSEFRDELVVVLTEINSYLINFFRGQLVVSMIDGFLTAIGLSVLGLQFGFLIGLFLAIVGIIPWVGFAVCYIPAVIIAFVQFNDLAHPIWVTVIFFIVQQIDGMVVAPRIVGNSVGLHPMTVIVSVFFWTLALGGLLGAVLAIPLTATVKVLMNRYVWVRQRSIFFDDNSPSRPKGEDSEIEIAT
jgi:predicted PurR-regulated permease PerM